MAALGNCRLRYIGVNGKMAALSEEALRRRIIDFLGLGFLIALIPCREIENPRNRLYIRGKKATRYI